VSDRIDDSELLQDFWEGLLLPRHVLNAKDVPLPDGARPQNIPVRLLGVVGLDAERHQALTDTFILIRILWRQGLRKSVPQLLEDN
jgi:hypothetical protein